MKRIYSNYNDSDFNSIVKYASVLGFTPAAFQKYCTLLYISKKNPQTITVSTINSTMLNKIKNISVGETFIVSSLFLPETWAGFTRSDKMTAAKQLSLFAQKHPDYLTPCGKMKNKTTIYRVLKRIDCSIFPHST